MIATVQRPLAERARNRLLRRVDWRFLLPDPRPARVCVLGADDLAEALELVADTVMTRMARDCDLAVLVDPDLETLRVARGALRPGGSLYVEWRNARWFSPARRTAQMKAAGFSAVRHFAPHPRPSRTAPERWVPLDESGVVDFAFRIRPDARSWVRRALRIVQRAAWTGSRRLRCPAWACALAVKDPGPEAARPVPAAVSSFADPRTGSALAARAVAPPGPSWEGVLRENWEAWGLGNAPERLHSLLLTGGARSVNKVVALVFADGSPRPGAAVKMPRVEESEPMLEREASSLLALGAREDRVPGIPRVLFHEVAAGVPLLGESVVLGRRILNLLDAASFPALARRATDWQILLAHPGGGLPQSSDPGRIARPVIERFERSYGQAVDARVLQEVEARIAALGPLPEVCEQRDFAPWNILSTGTGELAVLDWESSELRGVPALDLIYLFTYLAIYLEGANLTGRQELAYRASLDSRTAVGAVVEESLVRYVATLDLGREVLHPLRLLCWMLHAESAHRRLIEDELAAPSRERLRDTLFLRLLETELRHGGS